MRVAVLGTGLLGGSIGLGCIRCGHEVVGFDYDPPRAERAQELGAITCSAASIREAVADVDLAFVAVPVGSIAEVAAQALDAGAPVVTDVGSVKQPVVEAVLATAGEGAARFVGGHPMAGSEQDGVDAARGDLFIGAAWVLTPTVNTDDRAYTTVRGLARELGAEVVSVTPADHDMLVSFVSHVPQLVASTLMDVAVTHEAEHRALLRLAAGGFRDMTRIAASQPAIWIDILSSNRPAVLRALDAYLEALGNVRAMVAEQQRDDLAALLGRARSARRNLPMGGAPVEELVEILIPVADEPGRIADTTTTASRLGVNVSDFYIAHSIEGTGGVLTLVVPVDDADRFEAALHDLGYQTSRRELA